MYGTVAVLAAIVFCYSVIADRLERTVFGGAVAFTAIGLTLGTVRRQRPWAILR